MLTAISFFVLSFLIFILKKPLVINSICVPLIFSIGLVFSYSFSIIKTPALLNYFPIFLFLIAALIYSGFARKGIIVYGVTYAELTDKIIDYLTINKIEFEQTQSTIIIKPHNIIILYFHNDRYAFARLMFKGKNTRQFINKIINELRQKDIKVNKSYSLVALITGIFLVITYFFVKSIISL